MERLEDLGAARLARTEGEGGLALVTRPIRPSLVTVSGDRRHSPPSASTPFSPEMIKLVMEGFGMPADDAKLLREKAAQCQAFARSAKLPDLAEMLLRVAEGFLARALNAERGAAGTEAGTARC